MIKVIGKIEIKKLHNATCHCGAVELNIELPNGIENPRRCNCSMCRRKGIIAGAIQKKKLHIVKGENVLSFYQFNTFSAKHFFCSICGIHIYHQRRSNRQELGFNIGCLQDVNPLELGEVITSDGINHIMDQS